MDNTTLGRALIANAAFSGLTGLTALTLAGRLAETLGPPAWSLRALGVGLLGFAALVARESISPGRPGTLQIIAADLAWTATAAVILMIAPTWLTDGGRAALTAVTFVVFIVAAAQWTGLRTLERARAVRSPHVEVSGSPGDGVAAHPGSGARGSGVHQ